jgi:hypothetical protein
MRATPRETVLRIAAVFALTLAAALPARAELPPNPRSAIDGKWHFDIAPYIWFSGIKGDVSVGPLTVPVDQSFSDIIKDFDFGLQAHFEGRKDRFGFGLDVLYTNLGAPVASSAPIVGQLNLHADVRQLFTEGVGFYRVVSGGRKDNLGHLDVLVGVRYQDTKARLSAQGPEGAQYDGDYRGISWVNAVAGVRFKAPLGSRVAVLGRTDVAGFGSDVTWDAEGDLAVRASGHWTLGAGYRYLDAHYDKGEGFDRKLFDIAYSGPRVWFSYAW